MVIKNQNYKLKIKGFIFNIDTIKQLKKYNFTIYWNDIDCYYWIYNFKINGIWFTSYKIDMNKRIIYLKKF